MPLPEGPIRRYLDDLGGRFEARLREVRRVTKRLDERGLTQETFVGLFEAPFDLEVLDRLSEPCLLGLERKTGRGVVYMVYEAVSAAPMHYQMLSVRASVPNPIRTDLMDVIESGWTTKPETWIDITAAYTGTVMALEGSDVSFEYKPNMPPLAGSRAYFLTDEAYRRLVCVSEGAVSSVGQILGAGVTLDVDIEALVKYHAGFFGFTGSGKSNLAALLARKALEALEDLGVVVVDVAGEYSVHLIDVLLTSGVLYVSEDVYEAVEAGGARALLASQAVPETLPPDVLMALPTLFERLSREGRVKVVGFPYTVSWLLAELEAVEEDESYGLAVKGLAGEMRRVLKESGVEGAEALASLSPETAELVASKLDDAARGLPARSRVHLKLSSLARIVREPPGMEGMVPPRVVAREAAGGGERLHVLYVPDFDLARVVLASVIDELFRLRKGGEGGRRVLVVIDEAQEFMPRDAKGTAAESNRAVERLLRQGRKYRLHGWVATQRVAHLNVSALQQLHSYFASTLPRTYDRGVIADAFGTSAAILDRTTTLDTGEWLFLSFKATARKNVPVFIKAENNEEVLAERLRAMLRT